MTAAVIVLGTAILALLTGLAWVAWAYVRPSAIRAVMIAQAQAEIERNAALADNAKLRADAEAMRADAAALKARAEGAEEKLRALREKYLASASGDDLGDEFRRLLSGVEPDTDSAAAVNGGGAVGPDGLPLRPIDPFAGE